MSENIHVNTGIGKIENNYGTVNVNPKNDENGFKVRLNFETVRNEIYALFELGKVFGDYDRNWIYLKNKEDFSKIYDFEFNIRDIFEKNYAYGKSCAYEVSMTLLSINSDSSNYPSLTSIINELKKDLINAEKLNELQNTLNKSKNMVEKQNVNLYSINTMNILLEKQIQSLNEVLRVVRMLEVSDLYKKENQIEDRSIDISNAPDEVKKTIWYIDFVTKYPIIGIVALVLFTMYLSKDYIYEQNKHFIHVNILHTEVAEDEKIKLNHIFNAGGQFISLYDEIKYKKNSEPSISKNELTMHFSALNFNDNGLLKYSDMDLQTRLNEYGTLRSKFEGHIHQKFSQYKSLYDAGLYIVLTIQTKDQKYLSEFDKNWKKFQENCDYETPDFDIGNIRSSNDMTVKSVEIFAGIQQWLNK